MDDLTGRFIGHQNDIPAFLPNSRIGNIETTAGFAGFNKGVGNYNIPVVDRRCKVMFLAFIHPGGIRRFQGAGENLRGLAPLVV